MLMGMPVFSAIWIVLARPVDVRRRYASPPFLVCVNERSGEAVELEEAALRILGRPPYPTDDSSLIVSFHVESLMALHFRIGWGSPRRIVDLAVEFRNLTNGRRSVGGSSLFAALFWFGIPASPVIERSGDKSDLVARLAAIRRLFTAMQPLIDWPRALLRGRYILAVADIEDNGIPVDGERLERLKSCWSAIKSALITKVDHQFGFFRDGRFDVSAFDDWLRKEDIGWPIGSNGMLDLSDETWRAMARRVPALRPLRELQATLTQVKPEQLSVDSDGRHRVPLRPFASKTSRNQPQTGSWLFGSAMWLRHLVKPDARWGLALIDWSQQEFGIAAALSGDGAMQRAYLSGDPYLDLARTAGARAPQAVREIYKSCALGVQNGMGAGSLARQTGLGPAEAQQLLHEHRKAYQTFWSWLDQVEAHALLTGKLQTVFGWQVAVTHDANLRFLRNFPMQANGAEMLRLACCTITDAGVRICATLHDALLIEAPVKCLEETIADVERHMREASKIVLNGFALRTKTKRFIHPGRFSDPRGDTLWRIIEPLLDTNSEPDAPAHQRNASCSPGHTRSISLYDDIEDQPL
jgi:hypothetical protein